MMLMYRTGKPNIMRASQLAMKNGLRTSMSVVMQLNIIELVKTKDLMSFTRKSLCVASPV